MTEHNSTSISTSNTTPASASSSASASASASSSPLAPASTSSAPLSTSSSSSSSPSTAITSPAFSSPLSKTLAPPSTTTSISSTTTTTTPISSTQSNISLSTSATAVPVTTSMAHGGQVHIIWDFESLPSPPDLSPIYVSQRIISAAESYGFVNTFKCICKENRIPGKIKRDLQDSGVEIEEIHSIKQEKPADVYILTRILRIVLSTQLTSTQQQHINQTIYEIRPILILLSSDADFARALSILRRSGAFSDVVLIHGPDSADSLVHSATVAMEYYSFLYGRRTIPSTVSTTTTTITPPSTSISSESPDIIEPPPLSTTKKDIQPPPLQPQPTRTQTPISTTCTPSTTTYPSLSSQLLPSTHYDDPWSHEVTDISQLKLATPLSSSMMSEWEQPKPSVASSIAELLGEENTAITYDTYGTRVSISAPTSQTSSPIPWEHDLTYDEQIERTRALSAPQTSRYRSSTYYNPSTITSPKHHRSGSMPSLATSHMTSFELTSQQRMERMMARHRNCLLVFHRVIAYCEQERIIPRESVIKKRLLDSKIGADLDFDEFISVVAESGEAMIEGDAPQRIIWPKSGRFACADFYCPTDRLSSEQTQEVLDFLIKHRPEVDRGRFGYSQYLARHGPKVTQTMPHGVLVELVQLLLNKKYLLFRKGKISVAPNIEQLVATQGNTFSFTTPSGAGITANTVNPYATNPYGHPSTTATTYGTTQGSGYGTTTQGSGYGTGTTTPFGTTSSSYGTPTSTSTSGVGSTSSFTSATATGGTSSTSYGTTTQGYGPSSTSFSTQSASVGYTTPTPTISTPTSSYGIQQQERPLHPPMMRHPYDTTTSTTSRMASFASAKPFTPYTASTLSSTSTTSAAVISRTRRSSSTIQHDTYTPSYQQGIDFTMPSPSPTSEPSADTPGIIDMHAVDRLAHACSNAKNGTLSQHEHIYGEHMPIYHYEQTVGLSAEPLWVAFCTISLRLCHQTNIGKLKHFKSTMQARCDIAKQEAAQKALDSCAFTLALNTAIADTCRIARERYGYDSPSSPTSLTSTIITRATQHIPPSNIHDDDDTHHMMDAVADLDRLLAISGLPPMIYVMESTILSHVTTRSTRTVWKCTGEIDFGMGCAPIKWQASQARKVDSKAHVACQLLRRIIHKAVVNNPEKRMGQQQSQQQHHQQQQQQQQQPYRPMTTSTSHDSLPPPPPMTRHTMPPPSILPRMYQPDDDMSRIHHAMQQIQSTHPSAYLTHPSPSHIPYPSTPPHLPRIPSRTVLQPLPSTLSHVGIPIMTPSPSPTLSTSSPLPSPPLLSMHTSWPLIRRPSDESIPPLHPRRTASCSSMTAFTWTGVDPMSWRDAIHRTNTDDTYTSTSPFPHPTLFPSPPPPPTQSSSSSSPIPPLFPSSPPLSHDTSTVDDDVYAQAYAHAHATARTYPPVSSQSVADHATATATATAGSVAASASGVHADDPAESPSHSGAVEPVLVTIAPTTESSTCVTHPISTSTESTSPCQCA